MTFTRRLLDDFRACPLAHILILLIPAIQYGLNYFASVAAVMFVLVAWHTRMRILPLQSALVVLAFSLSLLWTALFLPEAPNFLRETRLAAGLLLLFWMLAGTPRYDLSRFSGVWPLLVLAGLALFALAQAIGAKKGIALYMPKSIFINSDDISLASSWVEHAKEHGYDWVIRPSAGFSEPSYLGGASLVLNFICLHTLRGRQRIAATCLALAACAVSQTFYGLISNLLITGVFYHRRFDKVLMVSLGMLALMLVALPIFAAEPGRLENILSGNDVSATLRITQPFELIGYLLAHDPFGVPLTVASDYFQQHGLIEPFEDGPFHNGGLNLFFAYGWLGFPLFVMLLRVTGSGICALFMVLLMAQNGAPLDFDKIVMLTLAIQIVRSTKNPARAIPARGPALQWNYHGAVES
jgi:hypothetical protein